MRRFLIDTDVFSFLFKNDSRADLYRPDLVGAQRCLSFQTVAELHFWTLNRRWGAARRQSLAMAISRCVVLPSDDDISRYWGEITAHRRALGVPIECGDAWIAATALRHAIPLLTHNSRDFADISNLNLVTHAP